jgi:hypothetical protein
MYRTLSKYRLTHFFSNFLSSGHFPSKLSWKKVVRKSVDDFERSQRFSDMLLDESFSPFTSICSELLSPVPPWLLGKLNPCYFSKCSYVVKLLGLLFCREFLQSCYKCQFLTYNLAEHLVFECPNNEISRNQLWLDIYSVVGVRTFLSFTRMNKKLQICSLCFGLCNLINDDLNREKCLKIACNFLAKFI